LGLIHIDAGQVLREQVAQGTAIGLDIQRDIEAGRMVEDAAVVEVVRERITRADATKGFILDGFPRNRDQALALGRALSQDRLWLTHVIVIEVPDDVAVDRMQGRIDASDAQPRAGDTATAQRQALAEYRAVVEPMLEIYDSRDLVYRVDGTGTKDQVMARLSTAIGTFG
jgi:adenylate kinase